LAREIEEFTPYVFQIIAQLLALRPLPLPEIYPALYQGIIKAENWKKSGNVPALNMLLRTYVLKAPEVVTQSGIEPVLGIMQMLIGSKMNDHEGLQLFAVLFEHIPLPTLEKYLVTIFGIFMQRLTSSPTVKYKHALLKSLSLFVCVHGVQAFAQKLDQLQPGAFNQMIPGVWLPEVQKINNPNDRKAVGCALVKMLEDPTVQQNNQLWMEILKSVLMLIEKPAEKGADDGDMDFVHEEGYDNAYSKLHFANTSVDLTTTLPDMRQALVQARESLMKGMPMIQQGLPADAQSKLQGYFQTAGVRLA